MKKRKKFKKVMFMVIAIPLTCLVLFFLAWFGIIYYSTMSEIKKAKERRTMLLYETNHEVLLEACRKVLEEARDGKWERRKRYSIRLDPHPDASELPKAILDLKPSYIFIEDGGRLVVEMLGGINHFGVIAYPENLKEPFAGWEHDRKLIEGLWYYDDGYREDPDYEKRIESLRPKSSSSH
jgi:hypothetical protein